MTIYTENPKNFIRKLLELIIDLSKAEEYKIYTQRSAAFWYTSNQTSQREIKETVSFTIKSESISRNKPT